ncbi:MAG: hypothetical protein WDN28_28920 [Chthoniobacter sp.]
MAYGLRFDRPGETVALARRAWSSFSVVLPPRATLKTGAAFAGSEAVAASRLACTTSATGQKSRVIPPSPWITHSSSRRSWPIHCGITAA